jgi:methylmalonyl-CoA mutase N-terminal domain/subunit
MRERFQAKEARSCKMRFHTQTAGSTLTAQQPQNNVVRVTLQALAAVLGGTQSLHTNSMDEALWLPSENAVSVALRTQQIIAQESGVANTIDPLAGSYMIEHLTGEIERRALEYIKRIDDMGGALAAVEHGYIQNEIQQSAYKYQQDIQSGEEIVVGVNAFNTNEEITLDKMVVDPAIEAAQHARLSEVRNSRDENRINELYQALENAARGADNLMPVFISCVESGMTLGEICGTLRTIWGEYEPPVWL